LGHHATHGNVSKKVWGKFRIKGSGGRVQCVRFRGQESESRVPARFGVSLHPSGTGVRIEYRGTSLIRNSPPLGTHSILGPFGGPRGGGGFV